MHSFLILYIADEFHEGPSYRELSQGIGFYKRGCLTRPHESPTTAVPRPSPTLGISSERQKQLREPQATERTPRERVRAMP